MADKYGNPPPSYGQPQGMYPNLNQPGPQQYPNQPYVPQTQPPQAAQHSDDCRRMGKLIGKLIGSRCDSVMGHGRSGGQSIIINRAKFGPFPVRTECPLCKQEVLTETYSSAGLLAWLLGTGLCLIGCSLGCCLIPCCVDACRDVVHKCPSCKQQIALFKRL